MKSVIKFSVFILAVFFLGCSVSGGGVQQQYPLSINHTGYTANAYSQASPREGWATDPYYSYRVYSNYPYNFYQGGFGVHGPDTGFNRFGF